MSLLSAVVALLVSIESISRASAFTQTPISVFLSTNPSKTALGSVGCSKWRSKLTCLGAVSIGSQTAGTSKKRTEYEKNTASDDRFDRTANNKEEADSLCILTIHGVRYNMTAWANAHPGGPNILKKFDGKDATRAFESSGHSDRAYKMLEKFVIAEDTISDLTGPTRGFKTKSYIESEISGGIITPLEDEKKNKKVPRWKQKLFTKEDPQGIHKTFGVFVLLHFVYRFTQMYLGDPSAGLGSGWVPGSGPSIVAAACLVPHAVLSLSSLIFHTVPRERVVGQPMIWQEYRVHNIAFAMRSIVSAGLAWLSIYHKHAPTWRSLAVVGCSMSVVLANIVADEATKRLRVNEDESTTATMPYWEGCSVETQRRFKSFYAYCQFMATLACLAVGNPAWPLAVLLPIQLASLLMTLVRKGLISARGYHIGYTISLVMPFFVGLRHTMYMKTLDFPFMVVLGGLLYQSRRRGVNKYVLWLPLVAARIAVGDRFVNWAIW